MGHVFKPSTIPTVDEYVSGLSAIRSRISESQLRLLQEQYYTPNRTATATQLAELIGIESGRGAINLMYGRLGRLFCEETGFEPSQREVGTHRWWSVWSSGYEEHNPYRFFWKMHPEVAEALEHLGWVNSNSVVSRYQQIFSELVYERDDRSPPDARRQAQFKIGWENAAMQRRAYTSETLSSVLTWNNLGYRFGLKLGQCSNSEIQAVYDFLAQEYQINSPGSKQLSTTNLYPDEVTSEEIFREGAVRQVSVNAYERDPKARQKCIDHYGLSCSVCSFNFGEFFGGLGKGFIHVHHLRPISEIAKEYEVDPVKHLRPVCPNCHAMIHRRSPPLSIEELQVLVSNSKVYPPPNNSGAAD
jgi:predicted HNH restriction endonuclease